MRSLVCALCAFVLCAVAIAKDYDGTITKIDGDKMTVKVGDKEQTFILTDATKIEGAGKKDTTPDKASLTRSLDRAKGMLKAKISTEEKDGKEVMKDGSPVAVKVVAERQKKDTAK